jgi:hypothetical protein
VPVSNPRCLLRSRLSFRLLSQAMPRARGQSNSPNAANVSFARNPSAATLLTAVSTSGATTLRRPPEASLKHQRNGLFKAASKTTEPTPSASRLEPHHGCAIVGAGETLAKADRANAAHWRAANAGLPLQRGAQPLSANDTCEAKGAPPSLLGPRRSARRQRAVP